MSSSTQAKAAPDAGARDILVVIRPLALNFWEYRGTQSQIEAEGVIPPNTQWPEGRRKLCWDAGRFSWTLGRVSPEGMKGPMRLWAAGDCWCLRCDLINGPKPGDVRALDMERELAAARHRQTAAGRIEWAQQCVRYRLARNDQAFQAFRSLITQGPKPMRQAPAGGQQ